MLALLNPRVWIALAILAALTFTHFTAYRHGKSIVRAEWTAAVAEANREARRIEERRRDAVGTAQRAATKRATVNRADAARSAGAVLGLRDAIAARRVAEESAAACARRADTLSELFLESVQSYRDMAETADRLLNDRQLLLEAWPR